MSLEYFKLNRRFQIAGAIIIIAGYQALTKLVVPAFKERILIPLGYQDNKKATTQFDQLKFPEVNDTQQTLGEFNTPNRNR